MTETLPPIQYSVQRSCARSEEHTSELQSRPHLVCRLLLGTKEDQSRNIARPHLAFPLLLGAEPAPSPEHSLPAIWREPGRGSAHPSCAACPESQRHSSPFV